MLSTISRATLDSLLRWLIDRRGDEERKRNERFRVWTVEVDRAGPGFGIFGHSIHSAELAESSGNRGAAGSV